VGFGKQAELRSGFKGTRLLFLFFLPQGLYLTRKTHRLVTGSAVSDDSQFFATATCIYPNLPEVCPANLI